MARLTGQVREVGVDGECAECLGIRQAALLPSLHVREPGVTNPAAAFKGQFSRFHRADDSIAAHPLHLAYLVHREPVKERRWRLCAWIHAQWLTAGVSRIKNNMRGNVTRGQSREPSEYR